LRNRDKTIGVTVFSIKPITVAVEPVGTRIQGARPYLRAEIVAVFPAVSLKTIAILVKVVRAVTIRVDPVVPDLSVSRTLGGGLIIAVHRSRASVAVHVLNQLDAVGPACRAEIRG
jgi:hypothetical protein